MDTSVENKRIIYKTGKKKVIEETENLCKKNVTIQKREVQIKPYSE